MFAASKTASVSGGYQISRSLRFNSADSAYLNRTLTTPTDNKKFTLSFWAKRSSITNWRTIISTSGSAYIDFTASNDQIDFQNAGGRAITLPVYRDVSAWYHIVCVLDTANSTANDRMIIYVNNTRQSLTTNSPPTQNATGGLNSAAATYIGALSGSSEYYDGYMTEVNFIDGQALTPSSFGYTNPATGVWSPLKFVGTYGTNGFYLNFSDNSNTTAATLGKDYSGNGNNWTPNNFSVTAGAGNDSLVDSPTSYGTDTGVGGTVRGNYATLNPLDKGADISTSNGNLDVTASTAWRGVRATLGMSSGKWYCEYTPTSGTYHIVSISQPQAVMDGYIVNNSTAWGYGYDGSKYNGGSTTSYGSAWGVGDTIGIAFDADAGTLTFYKNNTSQGVAYSGLTNGPYLVGIGVYPSATGTFNFGQRPFAYTAPSGYKALCTQNLPTPTIGATTATQAGKYFNPVLYTGTGSSLSVTGVGFQPDWVWVKSRSAATDHGLYDAVRGVQKQLESNNTGAETTETTGITSFGSDGFTTGSLAQLNTSSATYVAWNWKANGSGSTNTAGQITSTVSANTTSGFSIVTFTTDGTTKTVGHGLGVKPSLIIAKVRNGVGSWIVMTDIINGSMQYGTLNTANAFASIGYSAPTSTVFQYNDNNGNTQVAYCFASIEGYSKFGSYTGNGSADGPFVYTGMRPAFLMIKRVDAVGEDWFIYDTTRSPNNANNLRLEPNLSDAEVATSNVIDFLSNGFKLRNTATSQNSNGINYIFAAFASAPFKFALAR